MQPAQLSLLPDQVPAPPPALFAQFPEPQLTAAVLLLARLIAKAAGPSVPAEGTTTSPVGTEAQTDE